MAADGLAMQGMIQSQHQKISWRQAVRRRCQWASVAITRSDCSAWLAGKSQLESLQDRDAMMLT